MTIQTFEKILKANDTGETGGHQAGIHIPKGQTELIAFLPRLKTCVKNPDSWLICTDEFGAEWEFRYVYYNNKHHDQGGTRDEYRITHMTKYFREHGAKQGDVLRLSGEPRTGKIKLEIIKAQAGAHAHASPPRIRLAGWRRVH